MKVSSTMANSMERELTITRMGKITQDSSNMAESMEKGSTYTPIKRSIKGSGGMDCRKEMEYCWNTMTEWKANGSKENLSKKIVKFELYTI